MRVLLDSHILLWSIFEKNKLSKKVQEIILNSNNLVFISIASLWEISIKKSLGRLSIPETFFDNIYKNSGFEILLIQPNHIAQYLTLPMYHRDPFDRMLIAQAQASQMSLITQDA